MSDIDHPSDPIAPACLAPAAPPLGVIEEVHGAVIDIRCTRLPPLHQALYVCLNDERYHFEVHRHLDEQRVRAIALHRTADLRRELPVFDAGGPRAAPVTPACLGRLLDGGPALTPETYRPIVAAPPPLSEAAAMGEILPTGIKVIDLLCPFVRGAAGRATGEGRSGSESRQGQPATAGTGAVPALAPNRLVAVMNDEQWRQDVARDTRRLAEAERDRRSLLAQTVFLGTLSVLFLLPLIGGAYLGRWLDGLHEGYSVRWTVNLILLGLALGVLNVYLFIRRHWRWTPFRFSLYIGPFGITATVATIWGILLALGLVCGRLTRHLSTENPGLPQTLAEGVVQTIEAAIAAVLPEETRRILPFVGSLWLFVVTANLTGLIPGLLSPTGDLSATAALAFLVFLSVHWFGIRSDGLKPYLRHYLAPNPVLLPFHLLGELSRTLALATRLFGNIMSLEMAALLVLLVAGLLAPVPVLMLHVVEALVQAYIFGMLALIYIAGGMQSREESASRQKGNTP